MSENSCRTCKVKVSWSQGADITNEGYRCLSCAVVFYRQQNKRYREAVEYVMTAKPGHYKSVESALVDINFVISELLEGK